MILPKARKIQFSNYFLIRILIKKTSTKTKILPKARKIQFSNYFLIRILIRKNKHQNQDLAKS